jgi:hypothetical protein
MNNLPSNHPSWGVAKEFHEALALGFSGALLEEARGGFNDTAFGDGGGKFTGSGRHCPLWPGAPATFLTEFGSFNG